MNNKRHRHIEDDETRFLWSWAQNIVLLRDYLYHVPNGGKRNPREAARMKGMGVRAGVSDFHLPLARGGFNGLWIELKAPAPHRSSTSLSQREWIARMHDAGHAAYVCKGWMAAKGVLEWYLALPAPSSVEVCPVIEDILSGKSS